jgi:hypothetical protein
MQLGSWAARRVRFTGRGNICGNIQLVRCVHIFHSAIPDCALRHGPDAPDTRVTRLRAWSRLTGWRFESSSAHREGPANAGLSSLWDVLGNISWRQLLQRCPQRIDAVRDRLGAGERAGLDAFFALDAEADQRADRAPELDRLLGRQVAEVPDLELAVGVLVDRERVDHANRVALPQPLELGDDLAAEVRMVEPQDDELHRSVAMPSLPLPLVRMPAFSAAARARRIIRSV